MMVFTAGLISTQKVFIRRGGGGGGGGGGGLTGTVNFDTHVKVLQLYYFDFQHFLT